MITALVILAITVVVGALGGFAVYWIIDVVEQRQADWEWGRIWPARTLQVALPYLADGSYYRAAPRAIRSGPAWPFDLPGPDRQRPGAGLASTVRAGEPDVAVPARRARRVLTATVPPHRIAAGTRPEAAPIPPPPATERYAPTYDEIKATIDARVFALLNCPDATSYDTVVRRAIFEPAAEKAVQMAGTS